MIIMKKIVFILALIPLLAFAQKEHVVKEYCKVSIRHAGTVYIQKGNGEKMKELKDSVGNSVRVKYDCVELLNYMSRQGWELVPIQVNSSFETFIFCRPQKEGE